MAKAKRLNRPEKIRRYMQANPKAKNKDIALHFGTTYANVYSVRRRLKPNAVTPKEVMHAPMPEPDKDAMRGRLMERFRLLSVTSSPTRLQGRLHTTSNPVLAADTVNHPPHYKVGGIETIDFIEAKGLDYNLGNVVKYVTRADHKGNKLQDLQKAKWYLDRAIEKTA